MCTYLLPKSVQLQRTPPIASPHQAGASVAGKPILRKLSRCNGVVVEGKVRVENRRTMGDFVGGNQLEAMVSDWHSEVRIVEGSGTGQRSVVQGQHEAPRPRKGVE